MSIDKKHVAKTVLKSFYYLFICAGVASVLLLAGSFYNSKQVPIKLPSLQISSKMEFPQDQKDLDAIAEKLAKEGEKFSSLQPASGEEQSAETKTAQ